jgi:putative SOS response-associated peptidase YedK
MCGRYTQRHSAAEVAERFSLDAAPAFITPPYNIAPTQIVPVIAERAERDGRNVLACKWGLVPFWSKDPALGNKLINAKAETLAEKPSFKYALEKRRCLIPADGFYEWDKRAKPSQPMFIKRRDDGLFAFAGLWEECKLLDGEVLRTCTIITVGPNELVGAFHHRMAAILRPEDEAAWLDPASKSPAVLPLLRPFAAEELEAYPVSTAVNSPLHDEAGLIGPLP